MPCIECSVIPVKDDWVMERENSRFGPYPSEATAVRVAIKEAIQFREQDLPAKVSVRDSSGNVCAQYCLCKDFNIAII